MIRLIERLMGLTRLTLTEAERAILIRKGRIEAILGAGEHLIRNRDVTERHKLAKPDIVSPFLDALIRERPDLVAAHLTEIRTDADHVAVVERDGRLYTVLRPDTRLMLWTDAGPWAAEHLPLTDLRVPAVLGDRLARAGLAGVVTTVEVADAHVAILTVDGVMAGTLEPGIHRFWNVGRKIVAKQVDTRWRTHDVTGHEILTKDRVTLRVNLTADFRVTDPVTAVTAVRDFEEALHRALALAFRKTLGALTLDALLADKVAVDAEAADAVRAEMAALGVEVGAIALKDVILPGEMREILTAVVAAEKEAEANVIRRREETNATRSLLNTAKVMAENPVMLRLKELEALETIAGKVERLTVHNGTEGLMTDLVKLRD